MIQVVKKCALALVLICLGISAVAQAPVTWTSADMYLAIRKLNVLGSVLYVAAHPDDENTRLIAYFAKDRMTRTGYLSMTRGDGGQNLIGDEQGIDLGLIRTQELLAARRTDGGEQFFTRAFDFGYSKSPQETFTKWDREKILSDVVWVIRKFQPDVIITRFPTTGEGGHGHHTASAILANEAFQAAADPARFPEQLAFVKPWQAKRILWNSFNFGQVNLTSEDQFKFDVGGYNPLLGKSYGEIAAISRSNHKSQGFGSAGSRGEAMEYFKTTGGTAPVSDILEGVDLSWNRVPGGAAISGMVDSIAHSFDLLHPENSVSGLVRLYQALQNLQDSYWKKQKTKETVQLIEQCSGLFIDFTSNDQFAVQTDSVRISFFLNNRLGVPATLVNLSMDGFDSSFNQPLVRNRNLNFARTFFVPADKPLTQPYWLAKPMAEGYFNVTDQQKIGQADVDPAYTVIATVTIEGTTFSFEKPVRFRFTDPVRGELYEPLVVVPPVILTPSEDLQVTTPDKHRVAGSLSARGMKRGFSTLIQVLKAEDNRPDKRIELRGSALSVGARNQVTEMSYEGDAGTTDGGLVFALAGSNQAASDMHEIKYDHIPYIDYFHPAQVKVKFVDLKTYNRRIGYIVGAGDKLPPALEQMGYEVTLLGDKELSRNNLQQFDAIITGVRAYNTNEWLSKHYDRLMKYVSDGGNLIVQYNNLQFRGGQPRIGPYPFTIANRRITDENAQVEFLLPDHRVLNFPNKITAADFSGWIQERSIYHATAFDKKNFETVLSMHDPGETNDEGSLIIGRYGRGFFSYTGLVFFRELPAGVPGGYRLLANLIALNKKKAF